jgi:hypothetical protein
MLALVSMTVVECGGSVQSAVVRTAVGRESDASTNGAAAGATGLVTLTADQAGAVVADAMLVTSQALYLAIANPAPSRSVSSSEGRLRIGWSEDADFVSGAGTYEITVNGYSIAGDDPFAEHYNGYVLTGTMRLRSQTGERTTIGFDLTSSHDDAEHYPATTLELRLTGTGGDDASTGSSGGFVRVNGREFPLAELSLSY